jgi:hypothetical protein
MTLPIGGGVFQRGARRWELLWVMMWPENEFATHWQPFSRLRVYHESCLSLLNRDGSLVASVGTMDPWELRECRWEERDGKSAAAREGRRFVRECLRGRGG